MPKRNTKTVHYEYNQELVIQALVLKSAMANGGAITLHKTTNTPAAQCCKDCAHLSAADR